ncbi:hypothetical protein MKX03_019452 [Papaver bracteatum]|nr:hypothetical protein MKX03_019452 [Papaver bracteatum]
MGSCLGPIVSHEYYMWFLLFHFRLLIHYFLLAVCLDIFIGGAGPVQNFPNRLREK